MAQGELLKTQQIPTYRFGVRTSLSIPFRVSFPPATRTPFTTRFTT